jgi:hypothetical protein
LDAKIAELQGISLEYSEDNETFAANLLFLAATFGKTLTPEEARNITQRCDRPDHV